MVACAAVTAISSRAVVDGSKLRSRPFENPLRAPAVISDARGSAKLAKPGSKTEPGSGHQATIASMRCASSAVSRTRFASFEPGQQTDVMPMIGGLRFRLVTGRIEPDGDEAARRR